MRANRAVVLEGRDEPSGGSGALKCRHERPKKLETFSTDRGKLLTITHLPYCNIRRRLRFRRSGSAPSWDLGEPPPPVFVVGFFWVHMEFCGRGWLLGI